MTSIAIFGGSLFIGYGLFCIADAVLKVAYAIRALKEGK